MASNVAHNNRKRRHRIRILLIDDNTIFLASLERLFKRFSELTIVGSATDAVRGLALTQELSPDVVLVDLQMPNVNGLHYISTIRATMPALIVIAMSLEDTLARAAVKQGGNAFVAKDELFYRVRSLIHELYAARAESAGAFQTKEQNNAKQATNPRHRQPTKRHPRTTGTRKSGN